jgi:hypothetical protein
MTTRPRKNLSSGRKSKRHSFKRAAGDYKLKKILNDIDDAKTLGVNLHSDISLNEMYSMLALARQQLKRHSPNRGKFKFDDMHDEQPPEDDGLDELARRIRRESKRARK